MGWWVWLWSMCWQAKWGRLHTGRVERWGRDMVGHSGGFGEAGPIDRLWLEGLKSGDSLHGCKRVMNSPWKVQERIALRGHSRVPLQLQAA